MHWMNWMNACHGKGTCHNKATNHTVIHVTLHCRNSICSFLQEMYCDMWCVICDMWYGRVEQIRREMKWTKMKWNERGPFAYLYFNCRATIFWPTFTFPFTFTCTFTIALSWSEQSGAEWRLFHVPCSKSAAQRTQTETETLEHWNGSECPVNILAWLYIIVANSIPLNSIKFHSVLFRGELNHPSIRSNRISNIESSLVLL